MSMTDLVRASRDGDQFHYLWAARRCLLLISPNASLKAITIEGASTSETGEADHIIIGEELIDVGEYYGSENIEQATLVRYIQLKHSTVRIDQAFTPSELAKTIEGFAGRYKAIQQRLGTEDLSGKIEFLFLSNRPISANFVEAIDATAKGNTAGHAENIKKLAQFTGLNGTALAAFCRLLHLDGNQEGLWDQRNILAHESRCYLPGDDNDAPVQLKELVTKKALSESADNPEITKMDVFRALKTDESRLFPAPCLIEYTEKVVPREQEPEIIRAIIEANGIPVIVHAAGGVGKSVFATRIGVVLPTGSFSVLYDCFGNGQYRNVSGYRHPHKVGLVQIANELAAQGLCHPLIPNFYADPSDFMKAFLYRLQQSITSLKSNYPEARLCIVIDAADNAQMAAVEIGEARSFVRDLIRESLPEGVQLVALCRTHRQDYLNPPPNTLRLELKPFSRAETASYLKQYFKNATEQDIDEFHRLSSQNPRVQSLALSRIAPLNETLRALGPNPTTVEATIENLLDAAVAKTRDAAGIIEKGQIDRMCSGLAVLRPLIPLSVLASMSGIDESAIKSFAFDLGHPLLVAGDSIQFRDEPAETWFRDRFKPKADDLAAFVESLKPFAKKSAYVASTLPQLMLEAGYFEELVTLALASEALPNTNPVEKRDVELQRLQFALKACLRSKRYIEAAKLALKAGGESAGNERQCKLLQENTDLTAVLLESDRIQEIVSRRTFGGGWIGSHHAYEAGLLSGLGELLGDARSRLRMASEWLRNWGQLPDGERQKEKISDNNILELATAFFNIEDPTRCAEHLRRWRPREISFRVGRPLASRFIDHGRYDDLDRLALAAGNNVYLLLAITSELRVVHRTPPKRAVERALRLALNPRVKLKEGALWNNRHDAIRAVTALVEAAIILSVGATDALIELLTRYLPVSPPRGLSSSIGGWKSHLLRAYALRTVIIGQQLNLHDLADDDLRKELESAGSYSQSQDAREFRVNIGSLLPWYILWATTLVNRNSHANLAGAIAIAKAESETAAKITYRKDWGLFNSIARVWFDTLLITENVDVTLVDEFDQWITNPAMPLFTSTLTHLTRLAARSTALKERSFTYASRAFPLIKDERENAESKSESYIDLARAVLTISPEEAVAYFNQAVEVASKIGDENKDRWVALLDLADRAASQSRQAPEIAYRLARCAELTYEYAQDSYLDWKSTVEAIVGLCGRSSFAILSRWRDRNFGLPNQLLPAAVNYLVVRGDLDPEVALALLGFRADWDEPFLLNKALEVRRNLANKEAPLGSICRYMTLEQQDIARLLEISSVLAKHGITFRELDERIPPNELEKQHNPSREDSHENSRTAIIDCRESHVWNAIFDGINLSDANDISLAHRRFNDLEPPYYHEHFFEEACRRVDVGKEAEFISAISEVTEFDLYYLREFHERIPQGWKNRLAIKAALAKTIKVFCRRFCMQITKNRYYEKLPLKTACELSGVPEEELVELILTAIGELTDIASASRLFTLVGLLAPKLTQNESLEALAFGLDLFDTVLEDSDGDGPWSSKLEPPTDIEGSVAGYIWACLAAPRASLRWEAAHVVRALCMFGQEKIVERLVAIANGGSADAFYDSHLHFYKLHALQWLLIGLARAAKDRPDIVLPYADFLTILTSSGEPHVLIRELAKNTILTLLDAGYLPSQPELRPQLTTVNVSSLPNVESKYYQRYDNGEANDEKSGDHEDEDDRIIFGIDIGPYWLDPLGRCFGKTQTSIEREVSSVIRRDWQFSGGNRWDEDERHRRKIFRDMETHHSHGSYPLVDELRFYLAYHAMMVTAGKLLETTPVHRDPEHSEDEFQNWLRCHDLTRRDGGWLADRRDPVPIELPDWLDENETDEWRWSITRCDFDRILMQANGRINLWGYWTYISGHREESIHVSSALVSSSRSKALLMALQSATNPHDYRIPDADDELQIDFDGFQLKGWVVERSIDSKLDEYDPWAGAIKYPPPQPAPFVTKLMNLSSDAEHRRWFVKNDHVEVAWSQVWGHFREKNQDEGDHQSGTRFQTSIEFIRSLLQKLQMDLIVKVEIERRRRYFHWERRDDEYQGYLPASARLFLISSDGNFTTL